MGCDIHGTIETLGENVRHDKQSTYKSHWVHTGGLHIHRDYRLFALMAGVRDYEEWGPVIPVKGVPDDLRVGDQLDDYYRFVIADDSDAWDAYRYTKRSDAERWVADGRSQWHPQYDDHCYVSDIDYHTPTWFSTGELCKVREAYEDRVEDYRIEPAYTQLCAIIAMMQTLDAHCDGLWNARLTVWFDN